MYNEFYGFSKNPFDVAPDPDFLYLTSSHREALDAMKRGIASHQAFISITGEVGTGKTTLIHHLLKSIDRRVKTAFIFNTFITFEELLESILRDIYLDVVGKDRETLLSQLIEYLASLDSDETVAVIIDEAQHLAIETLQDLGKLPDLGTVVSTRLQIIFVGQPELEDILNTSSLTALNKNIRIKQEISPLSAGESREYISHRLKLVGSSTSNVFTTGAVSEITAYAKGIPRLINIVCDNALLSGFSISNKKINAKTIREVIKNLEGVSSDHHRPAKTSGFKKPAHRVERKSFFSSWHVAVILLLTLVLGGIVFAAFGFLRSGLLDRQSLTSSWISLFSVERPVVSKPQTVSPKTSIVDAQHPRDEIRTQPAEQHSRADVPVSAASQRAVQEVQQAEYIIVRKGESVTRLAEKHYGRSNITLAALIQDANPEITNADLISINQKIRIPRIAEGCLIVPASNNSYKINVGTFLNPNFANLFREEPSLKGKNVEVIARKATPKDTWYQVIVGNYKNSDDVLKEIAILKERNLLPLFGADPKMR